MNQKPGTELTAKEFCDLAAQLKIDIAASTSSRHIGDQHVSKEDLEALDAKLNKLSDIHNQIDAIQKKAIFRSKLLGTFISSCLAAQLGIIAVGTWSVLSWDIMEPISYLFGLGNFTAAFGWYYLHINNPDCQNPVDWYRVRVERKLQSRQGISQETVEALSAEIAEMRQRILEERAL